jgi:hypothetical protein
VLDIRSLHVNGVNVINTKLQVELRSRNLLEGCGPLNEALAILRIESSALSTVTGPHSFKVKYFESPNTLDFA